MIIPAYDAERFIGAALDSVLAQTFRDFEVLVVDDGSSDRTDEVVGRYGARVRYVRQPNGGVSAARNRGVDESTGRLLTFLDADDTWLPYKLERQVAFARLRRDYGAVFARYTVVDASLAPIAEPVAPVGELDAARLLVDGNLVFVSTAMVRRDVFHHIGGFDPELSQCADWDLWVRVGAVSKIGFQDEVVATYRQHGANMSRSASLMERDTLRVLDKGCRLMGWAPGDPICRRAFGRGYTVLAGSYYREGHLTSAVRCAMMAVRHDPSQIRRIAAFPWRVGRRLLGRA